MADEETPRQQPLYNPYHEDGRRKHHHAMRQEKFLWERRHQPVMRFKGPEEFLSAAKEYFRWCEENPIKIERVLSTKNGYERVEEYRPRAMTLQGLATHIGMSVGRLSVIISSEADLYGDAVSYVSDIIKEQKFTGAAAGVFNSNLIIRDLGLADPGRKPQGVGETESEGKTLTGVNVRFKRPSLPAPSDAEVADDV
jgi:hypothetical protein